MRTTSAKRIRFWSRVLLKLSEWSTDSWMESKTRVKQTAIDTVLGSPEEENSIQRGVIGNTAVERL
ncbi:MAG: hypothetical protein ACXWC8_20955 [Limisphaerales bacterium]